MIRLLPIALTATLLATSVTAWSKPTTYLSIEESRIEAAQQAEPEMVAQFTPFTNEFTKSLNKVKTSFELLDEINRYGDKLWLTAVEYLQKNQTFDDRPLYWGRLQMAKALRQNPVFRSLSEQTQQSFMARFEFASRGDDSLGFSNKDLKKILVTGFDPFFLDRNIAQSNPSGIAAMYLDGKVIELNGEKAQIEALLIPVRFADFDRGMIEAMLAKRMKQVDMVATISMGREEFDLERFPGLRRSSKAPGNLNLFTGATAANPLPPFLHDKVLNTPEFVEFSLPVKAMQKAKGPYKVIDNHKVETLARGKFEAKSLAELQGETSVQGSGGGYLSNEISYRSIVLRDQLNPTLPVGHIHTPRIQEWKKPEVKGIVLQIEEMLRQAIKAI